MAVDNLTIPFQGKRSYITGVQLAETALARSGLAGDLAGLTVNCYRMIRSNAVALTRAETPLSPKDYAAIVRLEPGAEGGAGLFFGLNELAGDSDDRFPCPDSELAACVEATDQRSVTLRNPGRDDGTLLAMLVLGIKTASQKSWPAITEKWIFASARLRPFPRGWAEARATSRAGPDAHVFPWAVEIDGQPVGTIGFFHIAEG